MRESYKCAFCLHQNDTLITQQSLMILLQSCSTARDRRGSSPNRTYCANCAARTHVFIVRFVSRSSHASRAHPFLAHPSHFSHITHKHLHISSLFRTRTLPLSHTFMSMRSHSVCVLICVSLLCACVVV